MNNESFKDLVRRMRDAQREYFRTRNPGALKRSKELEKQVDLELVSDDNPSLFD